MTSLQQTRIPPEMSWNDISGLDEGKQSIMERIIWPDTHPESRGGGGG